MPAVLYDHQVFAEQRHGGVSRYFAELMRSVAARGNWEPLVGPGIHVYPIPRDSKIRRVGLHLRVPPFPRRVRVLQVLNAILATPRLNRARPAVYHPTWYHLPTIERHASLPMVLTIHDLIPEDWPAVTTPTQITYRREAIARARSVICISESTKTRLALHYPQAARKAAVAYLGLTLDPTVTRAQPVDGPPYPYPYFVFVGRRGSYKDFPTVLAALARIDHTVGLVTAGGGRLEARFSSAIERTRLGGRVWNEPAPSEERLAQLLRSSSGLVSASREEGFGLPALEALAVGVPALLSDIAVYRELYGDWATFFPPGQTEALASIMEEAIMRPRPLVPPEELRSRFSWDRAAAVAEQAYEEAVSGA